VTAAPPPPTGRDRSHHRVLQDWGIPDGRKVRPRLKQQDAALRIGAQSGRKNRTGRAAAYNKDVEDLHDGPWYRLDPAID